MRGVLEGSASVCRGRQCQEPAARGEAAVGFLHDVDGVFEVFEGVVGAEDADLSVFEGPFVVEVGVDGAFFEVYAFISFGWADTATEVDFAEAVEVAPFFDEWVDVLVVDVEGFGLDEAVQLFAGAVVFSMDVVDVEALVDVVDFSSDVCAGEEVLVV